jgi:hypothetical protein
MAELDPHAEASLFRSLLGEECPDLAPYPHEGTEADRVAWVEEGLRRNTESLEHHKRIRSILRAMESLLEE